MKFLKMSDIDPAALAGYGDWLEKGEQDFIPISERLDALAYAMADGWCPARAIEAEIDHLNSVLTGYHCAKYLNETLRTLQDAEADLARWRALSPDQRREIEDANARAKAEEAARYDAARKFDKRKADFYAAMKRANVLPSPEVQYVLDKMMNPHVI
jgi:hypothetical protein